MTRYDLPAMVKRSGRFRRKAITMPAIVAPAALQAELASIYIAVAREWRIAANERILPAYAASLAEHRPGDGLTRDDASSLRRNVEAAEGSVRVTITAPGLFRRWLTKFEAWFRKRWVRNIKTATGIEAENMIGPGDVAETLEAALARNVALIRNVDDATRAAIEDIVWRGVQAQTLTRDIAKEIAKATEITKARALRIASDQTVKIAAKMDQDRAQQMGLDEWIWRHSGKVHFRPEHKARDGKHYFWSDNNLDGDLPGVAIHCGCKAQPYLNLEDFK